MTAYRALQEFSARVTEKATQVITGELEDQLRAPFEELMRDTASLLGTNVVCTGEARLPDRLGQPDYAVLRDGLLCGYVELKAPGVGVTYVGLRGRNRDQFDRFAAIPNMLYSDGNQWALYRNGEAVRGIVTLSGNVLSDGETAVSPEDATQILVLLRDFLLWEPQVPTDSTGRVDLDGLATLLAPLCRLLRDDVLEALQDSGSPLVTLADEWRKLLFPAAPDEQFADAYAQTATFALLLGRTEGADPLTLETATVALEDQHSLLARALQVLTDARVKSEIVASLNLLLRVIAAVPSDALRHPEDFWLYFYETFLAAYDPELRRNTGVYYTPVEVVRAQVRLIDDLLVNRLDKPLGFADSAVITLDPAVGTGTYLLGVIEHALGRVRKEHGPGAIPAQATDLAESLYGFELLVGPLAVSELRITRALQDQGATIPDDGMKIYLTDTLESPTAQPLQLVMFYQPIADQHAKALEVKRDVPVIVCLGNPPYDRHEAAGADNRARTGNWVRWGDDGGSDDAILDDFSTPVRAAGHGHQLKNLYNLYVYFWRWALWKVFEQEELSGPGVVSFITASSYLDGPGFTGMREHMRRTCDAIWILDLLGEGRGTRRSENVFDIQTPVAIAIAYRGRDACADSPAAVRYARIEGTRGEKLRALEAITGLESIEWSDCSDDWDAPFRPPGEGPYFSWPSLTDIFPWQHSGSQLKRTWPIAPDRLTLERRWQQLVASGDRASLLRETTYRTIDSRCSRLRESDPHPTPIRQLTMESPMPNIERYAYRSFDRQWVIADARVADRPRPVLWNVHGPRQVYFTSLIGHPLGAGPAVTACHDVPDLHHFRGSYGAKHVIPLYRNSEATEPNIAANLTQFLSEQYGCDVTAEAIAAYVYGILGQPAFTRYFATELESGQVRVPFTTDAELFAEMSRVGGELLQLHCHGAYGDDAENRARIRRGVARCLKAIPSTPDTYPEDFGYDEHTETLHVGGGEVSPVKRSVYECEVSGLKVLQSWLQYRMRGGKGRRSSPLDDVRPDRWSAGFTTDLLELLWILEASMESYVEQSRLLDVIMERVNFEESELPQVAKSARGAPGSRRAANYRFEDGF